MQITPRQQKINKIINARQEGIVVLEDIYDPHNAAAVIRTMDAFAFQKAYFTFPGNNRYNPKKVGKVSSASANKWISMQNFNTIEECYEDLKNNGFVIYATTLAPDRLVNLFEPLPELGPKIAIVLGNEHTGISPYASAHADYHLYIPMKGFVQSLNISVCAGVVFAEITRQRSVSGMRNFSLPASEKENLSQKWK